MPELRQRWGEQKEFIAKRSFLQLSPDMPKFIKTATESDAFEKMLHEQGPAFCFPYFNPDTKDLYKTTVDKWTTTLMEISAKARDMPQNALSSLIQTEQKAKAPEAAYMLPLKIGAAMLCVVVLMLCVMRHRGRAIRNKAEEAPLVQQPMVQVRD